MPKENPNRQILSFSLGNMFNFCNIFHSNKYYRSIHTSQTYSHFTIYLNDRNSNFKNRSNTTPIHYYQWLGKTPKVNSEQKQPPIKKQQSDINTPLSFVGEATNSVVPMRRMTFNDIGTKSKTP